MKPKYWPWTAVHARNQDCVVDHFVGVPLKWGHGRGDVETQGQSQGGESSWHRAAPFPRPGEAGRGSCKTTWGGVELETRSVSKNRTLGRACEENKE